MNKNLAPSCTANQCMNRQSLGYEHDNMFAYTALPSKACPRCRNLLQNPSFETGLIGWETNNVATTNGNPFEGTQTASMGPGVASMLQDILLVCPTHCPLFLSFGAIADIPFPFPF